MVNLVINFIFTGWNGYCFRNNDVWQWHQQAAKSITNQFKVSPLEWRILNWNGDSSMRSILIWDDLSSCISCIPLLDKGSGTPIMFAFHLTGIWRMAMLALLVGNLSLVSSPHQKDILKMTISSSLYKVCWSYCQKKIYPTWIILHILPETNFKFWSKLATNCSPVISTSCPGSWFNICIYISYPM